MHFFTHFKQPVWVTQGKKLFLQAKCLNPLIKLEVGKYWIYVDFIILFWRSPICDQLSLLPKYLWSSFNKKSASLEEGCNVLKSICLTDLVPAYNSNDKSIPKADKVTHQWASVYGFIHVCSICACVCVLCGLELCDCSGARGGQRRGESAQPLPNHCNHPFAPSLCFNDTTS